MLAEMSSLLWVWPTRLPRTATTAAQRCPFPACRDVQKCCSDRYPGIDHRPSVAGFVALGSRFDCDFGAGPEADTMSSHHPMRE